MQVTITQVDALAREVKVQIPDAELEKDVARRLKAAAAKVRIDGFRPGKAPLHEVRRRYGPSLRVEAIDDAVQAAMPRALDHEDLKGTAFVTQPELVEGVKAGSTLIFRFVAERFPEFEPQGYTGIELTRPAVRVTAEEIDREITALRRSRSVVEPVEDRTVSERGDVVVLDVEVTDADAPEAALAGEGQEIDTSDPNLVPGLGDQLAGFAIGEKRTISLALPPTFPVEEVAGQTVQIEATLSGLKRRVLPEVDDELARDSGLGETVEAMRAEIERRITAVRDGQIRRDSTTRALSLLIGANPFDLPQRYVDDLARREAMNRLQEMARRSGVELPSDADPGEIVPAVRPLVEQGVREAVLLDRIALAEQIDVTADVVDARLQQIAEQNKVPVARVRAAYQQQSGALDQLRSTLRRERALDFILDRASFTEVEETQAAEV